MGSRNRQYWLETESGHRIRVPAGGLLLGRGERCEVLSGDVRAHRRHAFVLPHPDGVEVTPLGTNPTHVDGETIRGPTLAAAGGTLAIPGCRFSVVATAGERGGSAWCLEGEGGQVFGMTQSPFTVGGGARDDLSVPAWPPGLLSLHEAQGALFVVATGEALCDGEPLAIDDMRPVGPGCRLSASGVEFQVTMATGADVKTAVADDADLPSRIEVEYLPRGARARFAFGSEVVTVWLSEMRADLITGLLRPPPGVSDSAFISDEYLINRIWPRQPEKNNLDLNTLISRVRKALVESGVDGSRLLERSPGGGGTRLRRQSGAAIRIEV